MESGGEREKGRGIDGERERDRWREREGDRWRVWLTYSIVQGVDGAGVSHRQPLPS